VNVSVTEILVAGGQRFRVEGAPADVETKILDAARGSILELVWLIEAGTGTAVALNPAHIVAIRDPKPQEQPASSS
jgi:hypothetical protein